MNLTIEAQAGTEKRVARVSGVAYSGGKMSPPGWPNVVVDLQGMSFADRVPLLTDHENRVGAKLGDVSPSIREGRLEIDGEVTNASAAAEGLIAQYERGGSWQMSIGVTPESWREVVEGEVAEVNGQTLEGPFILVVRSRLREVSVVAIGADEETSLRIAAAFDMGKPAIFQDEKQLLATLKRLGVTTGAANGGAHSKENGMEFEKWIKARGFEPDDLNEKQKEAMKLLYDAEVQAAAGDGEPPAKPHRRSVKEVRAEFDAQKAADEAVKAERARVAGIQAAYQGLDAKAMVKAINEGISIEAAQAKALDLARAELEGAPAVQTGQSAAPDAQVLEAAACLTAGIRESSLESYGDETLTAARKLRGVGIKELAASCALQHGKTLPREIGNEWMRAAFANTDLGGILGNVANKALQAAFENVPAVAPRIARSRSHSNFHSHTVYSLALDGGLEEVGPRGELKSMSLSEESRTRQVKTRGAAITISRADLINDEIGALADMAERIGRKAAQAREQITAKALNDTGAGSSFFTSARGNYISGSTTNLGDVGLGAALQKFREMKGPQKDESGSTEFVDVEPRIVLVPPALERTCLNLLRSVKLITGEDSTQPDGNFWAGMFTPIVWSRIGTVGGGTNTNWYLMADPMDVPTIEISYLNGIETPTVDFFGLDQDVHTLGVSWRVYWDLGIDLAEWRGGLKSKGAA